MKTVTGACSMTLSDPSLLPISSPRDLAPAIPARMIRIISARFSSWTTMNRHG
jgi:hypothetical protein